MVLSLHKQLFVTSHFPVYHCTFCASLHIKQESCAIAKMTARCALYMSGPPFLEGGGRRQSEMNRK